MRLGMDGMSCDKGMDGMRYNWEWMEEDAGM